jgi:dienelactone hydrolase
MGRITGIVIWLVALALVPFHLAEVQQSKKVAYIGLLENGSLSLIAPLTDALVRMLLSAVPAYAQEEVSSSTAQNLVQPQILKISLKGAGMFGGNVAIVTHLYKPLGDGPFPVVIFSHGRGPEISDRLNLKYPVMVGHGNFWLRKGFAVVAPVRPGYGESEGMDHEDAGSKWRRGQCIGEPDFFYLAKVAGEAVLATLDWVRAQTWANQEKILLVGVSVGGLTSAAIAAKGPPGLVGYINFSGGAGGSPRESPGKSCKPENLSKVFGEFGKTTRVPSLWLYAENDLYWGPDAPKEWHRAFSAGGSKTTFVMTSPVPGTDDGHRLLAVGGKLWSPHVNSFVKELGF